MQEKNLSVIIGHCSNWIKVRSQVRRLYLRHGRGLVYTVAGGDCKNLGVGPLCVGAGELAGIYCIIRSSVETAQIVLNTFSSF